MSMNNAQIPQPRMINGRPDPIAWTQVGINNDGSITYQHKHDSSIMFRYRLGAPAKNIRRLPPPAPKKLSAPKKPVNRKVILTVLEECQPATPDLLRLRMRERGYDLDGVIAVKRMSNIVYRLRMAGEIKRHSNNALTLPDYTGPIGPAAVKPLARDAVVDAVRQCQPASLAALQAYLLDAGYSVGDWAGKRRLSATLGYLKKVRRVRLQPERLWVIGRSK